MMIDYNAGYVAGIEEVIHLIEYSKYNPISAVDYAEQDTGEGHSQKWRDGREDALTKLYLLFQTIQRQTE